MDISYSDTVIQYDGKNAEDVLAHSEVVTAMNSVDGVALFYNDSSDGNPNAAQVPVGAYVGKKTVYKTLDGFDYEAPVVDEPVVEPVVDGNPPVE